MDNWIQAFKTVAPFLQEPLVLVGFVLLLVFGVQHGLFRAKPGIVPELSQGIGGKVVLVPEGPGPFPGHRGRAPSGTGPRITQKTAMIESFVSELHPVDIIVVPTTNRTRLTG